MKAHSNHRSAAYRAVILAVLMVSSVAIMGVGLGASGPVSMDAADWHQTSGGFSSISDNSTNGGIDFLWGVKGEWASNIEQDGQVTLFYEAEVEQGFEGIGIQVKDASSNTQSFNLASGLGNTKTSGSLTLDVEAGGEISLIYDAWGSGSGASATISTNPLGGPTNSPPEAILSAPATAVEDHPISLDASGSSDPDGDALSFAWDLDADGDYDDATGATLQHSFADPGVQPVSVEVSDGTDTDTADATIEVAHYAPLDVKPDSDDNPVNPKAKGVLPVAILNTDDFDPTAVVVESLVLSATEGGDGAAPANGGHFEDVDGDGDDDLVVKFSAADLGLDSETTTLYLSGEMADGLPLVGSDDVTVVGNDKGNNGNGNGR